MRSYLFVPGDQERKLAKAATSGADCLLIDLEDSVATSRKSAARAITSAYIRERRKDGRAALQKIAVRINGLSTGLADDDLAEIIASRPDAVLLPKTEGRRDVEHLSAMLTLHEANAGLAEGSTGIHALITETARGVLEAVRFAAGTPRLLSLAWGGEDLAADLGAISNRIAKGAYGDVFRLARSLTLLAATEARVDALDAVFTDYSDMHGLERECQAAVRDGFSGKMAIHPAQVAVINRAFTPSIEQVSAARRIIACFEEAGADAGVVSLDGVMLDRPHLKQAERILARYDFAKEHSTR